MTMLRK